MCNAICTFFHSHFFSKIDCSLDMLRALSEILSYIKLLTKLVLFIEKLKTHGPFFKPELLQG